MKKKTIVVSRRQFLHGAGGVAIGLPFLPSLVPVPAYAAEVSFRRLPRFVAMTTDHGGVYERAMYPEEALLTETHDLFPGHQIRSGRLKRTVEGNDAFIATVLRGAPDKLTDRIVAKMNVVRGLDIPFYIAHNTGGHLGNYARNDGNGAEGKAVHGSPMPTIDQLMAWSPSFYKDLGAIRQRSIVTGPRGGLSWGFSNPSARSGNIVSISGNNSASALFDRLFVPGGATMPAAAPRPIIVDRVLDGYKTLRQSNKRLSPLDRQRLDDHMDRLAELQRQLKASAVSAASCKDVRKPTSSGGPDGHHAALNSVIAGAFLCGSARIVVIGCAEHQFSPGGGDWHQGVAHQWNGAGQPRLQQAARGVFRSVFLDLVTKLEVEEAPGVTVLDNSLVAWSQESGEETHDNRSMPLVLAGAAAGSLKTGLYVDYRNLQKKVRGKPVGLTWNQWLATALQAMGVPRAEWQGIRHNGAAGYGHPQISGSYRSAYVTEVRENANDFLPLLKA
jgi:hypothetical protein